LVVAIDHSFVGDDGVIDLLRGKVANKLYATARRESNVDSSEISEPFLVAGRGQEKGKRAHWRSESHDKTEEMLRIRGSVHKSSFRFSPGSSRESIDPVTDWMSGGFGSPVWTISATGSSAAERLISSQGVGWVDSRRSAGGDVCRDHSGNAQRAPYGCESR
jgi:hypothetical protein